MCLYLPTGLPFSKIFSYVITLCLSPYFKATIPYQIP